MRNGYFVQVLVAKKTARSKKKSTNLASDFIRISSACVKLVEVADVGSMRSTSHFCFGSKHAQLHCQMVDRAAVAGSHRLHYHYPMGNSRPSANATGRFSRLCAAAS